MIQGFCSSDGMSTFLFRWFSSTFCCASTILICLAGLLLLYQCNNRWESFGFMLSEKFVFNEHFLQDGFCIDASASSSPLPTPRRCFFSEADFSIVTGVQASNY